MSCFYRLPPDNRVSVEFDDLRLVVNSQQCKGEKKTLLDGVSGRFRAGEIVAVIGPSGAGKTTLLNAISGYLQGLLTGGTVRLVRQNGEQMKNRKVFCYLPQDDRLVGLFTAREVVSQATSLKVGSRISKKLRDLIVDDALEALGLTACRDTRVSSLSGGQRKRLSLAAELVDNPSVIFLDEPTTGLDVSAALQCILLMQRLARSGRTVICTIHQPSDSMLNYFDKMFVMAKGRCVFRGPPSNLLPFMNEIGYECPRYHNPADFLMEILTDDTTNSVDAMVHMAQKQQDDYPPPLQDHFISKETASIIKEPITEVQSYLHDSPSEWERFRVLLARCFLQQHRDWVTTHLKLFAAVVIALLFSAMYGTLGNDASRSIANIGLIFIMGLYITYTAEAPAIMKYGDEIPIVKKEWFNNWYKLTTYSLALLIASLPMHVMTCTAFCSIIYYMTAQIPEPLRFAALTLILILTSIVSESVGLQVGSLFLKRRTIGLFIACIHLAYMILLSGFLLLKPEMPEWVQWFTHMNHLRYYLDGAVVAVYQNRERLKCPENVIYCHLREPSIILKTFGLTDSHIWQSALALVVICLILRITSYLSLRRNMKYTDI